MLVHIVIEADSIYEVFRELVDAKTCKRDLEDDGYEDVWICTETVKEIK